MTEDKWSFIYSNLLHDAAERWGLSVLPGRPLIGLPPVCEGKGEGIVGNPYVVEPIAIVSLLGVVMKSSKLPSPKTIMR